MINIPADTGGGGGAGGSNRADEEDNAEFENIAKSLWNVVVSIPVDPGGGGGAGGSNRSDEEDNAGGQCQGLGTVRHHERLQGDVPGTDQASKLHVTWCAQLYPLVERPRNSPPPPAFGLAVNEGAIGPKR